MGAVVGRIESKGPFIDVTVMATHPRVLTLKSMNLPVPAPVTIRALIDTGAQASVVDRSVIHGLSLTLIGSVAISTPSTGSNYATLEQYDAGIFIGSPAPGVSAHEIGVLAADLAGEGFCALIGWDILDHCVLMCDGPARRFTLEWYG